jgi:hypothetical protein
MVCLLVGRRVWVGWGVRDCDCVIVDVIVDVQGGWVYSDWVHTQPSSLPDCHSSYLCLLAFRRRL